VRRLREQRSKPATTSEKHRNQGGTGHPLGKEGKGEAVTIVAAETKMQQRQRRRRENPRSVKGRNGGRRGLYSGRKREARYWGGHVGLMGWTSRRPKLACCRAM
jgi:hypothetical protein